MTVPPLRPAISELRVGSEFGWRDDRWRVVAMQGQAALLRSLLTGDEASVLWSELLLDPSLELSAPQPASLAPTADTTTAWMEALPPEVVADARERERHLLGAIAAAEQPGRTLTEEFRRLSREHGYGLSTLWRWHSTYPLPGVGGLRTFVNAKYFTAYERKVDPKVVDAIDAELREHQQLSTIRAVTMRVFVRRRLRREHGENGWAEPSDSTWWRLLRERAEPFGGLKASGARKASIAKLPATPYSTMSAEYTGQLVIFDSTGLSILALDRATGKLVSCDLHLAIDVYSRSVVAVRVVPRGIKGIEASMLLREVIAPKWMREGWPDSARWRFAGVPERVVVDLSPARHDDLGLADIPPLAVDAVIVDHAKAYLSELFQRVCADYGITIIEARPLKATDKAVIEAFIKGVRTHLLELFAKAGYTGRNVVERGRGVRPALYLDEIEDIIWQWVATWWQRRAHEALRDYGAPALPYSPNEMVDRSWSTHGFIHWPVSQNIYYELLPIHWCAIHPDGVSLQRKRARFRYDGSGLNGFRLQKSPYGPRNKGLWPLRFDPRDRRYMYFQNPDDGSWHRLTWKHLTRSDRPMDDRLTDEAAERFFEQHRRNASERELAQATEYLLDVIEDRAEAARAEGRTQAARLGALAQVVADDRGEADADDDTDPPPPGRAAGETGDFDFSDEELSDLEVGS